MNSVDSVVMCWFYSVILNHSLHALREREHLTSVVGDRTWTLSWTERKYCVWSAGLKKKKKKKTPDSLLNHNKTCRFISLHQRVIRKSQKEVMSTRSTRTCFIIRCVRLFQAVFHVVLKWIKLSRPLFSKMLLDRNWDPCSSEQHVAFLQQI